MNAPTWLNRLWLATLVVHIALAVGIAALILHSAERGGWLLAAMAVVPLLLPLPGLLRRKPRAGGWACLLVSFYVALLLADVYMHPAQAQALLALSVLAAADFVLLSLWVKGAAKFAKRQLAA